MGSTSVEFEPWVDVNEIADYLTMKPKTVLAKVRAGIIPATPIDPLASRKIWRFKKSKVDAALNQRVDSTSRPSPDQKRKIA